MKQMISLIIADDHEVVRSGLQMLFQQAPAEFKIVGEASDGEELIELVEKRMPDVVVMDISMPKITGIEATRILREKHPKLKILILTIHDSEEYVYQMLRAGANGYVLKDTGKKELFDAVHAIMEGEQFFSPSVSKIMIDEFIRRAKVQSPRKLAAPSHQSPLTQREREVLCLITEGMTNAEIAEKLFLSVRTIDTHRTNIMNKLDIHDTAGLVRYAIENGYVTLKKPQQ